MSHNNIYDAYDYAARPVASSAGSLSRLVTKTYVNLTAAIIAFAVLETLIFAIVGVQHFAALMIEDGPIVSVILLVLCLGGPSLGNALIGSQPSRLAQYGLLAYYVVLYAVIFIPILTIAQILSGNTQLIWQATSLTVALFIALSAAVYMTRKDFSFLRTGLVFGSFAALILIVAAFVFGFDLGMWFAVAMIALMCGYILYSTSQMIYGMDEGDDVFMAISLFSSVMMLFYYILRILMILNRR